MAFQFMVIASEKGLLESVSNEEKIDAFTKVKIAVKNII